VVVIRSTIARSNNVTVLVMVIIIVVAYVASRGMAVVVATVSTMARIIALVVVVSTSVSSLGMVVVVSVTVAAVAILGMAIMIVIATVSAGTVVATLAATTMRTISVALVSTSVLAVAVVAVVDLGHAITILALVSTFVLGWWRWLGCRRRRLDDGVGWLWEPLRDDHRSNNEEGQVRVHGEDYCKRVGMCLTGGAVGAFIAGLTPPKLDSLVTLNYAPFG
jgi:hypothetical protein